jgi:hypothetical protein
MARRSKKRTTRRRTVAGGAAVAGIAASSGLYLVRRHRSHQPVEDEQANDREPGPDDKAGS